MATTKGNTYALSMDVAVSALLTVNPQEFYTKALLEQRSTSYFRQVLNVKQKTKIGNLGFEDPIQEFDCSFSATNANLSAKEFEPCKLKVNVEVCLDSIESSFIAQWLQSGSDAAMLPNEFQSFFFQELSRAVSNSLEQITFKGDTSLSSEDVGSLAYCDGLEKKLGEADIPAGQRIALVSGGLTVENIVEEMQKMYDKIPATYKNRDQDILWMIPTPWAALYKQRIAKTSIEMYFTKNTELTFLGIPLVVAEGMSADKSFITRKDNVLFIADLISDQENIEVIDMRKTLGEPNLRVVSWFKFGVGILNDEEFVVYNIADTTP